MIKHAVKFTIVIIIVWACVAWFVWLVEAKPPKIALVDQSPWHVELMQRVLGDTPHTLYNQGAVIGIEAAARDGMPIIVVPGWLDNAGTRGDCLPVGYIGGAINALKAASKTSQVFIGAADCPLFAEWATTVAALDMHGNRPAYLPPVADADIYIEACTLGICSDSEAIVRAGIEVAQ